jgi:hypothetical protein
VQGQEPQDAKQQPAGPQQQQGLLLLVPLTLGVGKVRTKLLCVMIAMRTVCRSMAHSVLCAGLPNQFTGRVMVPLALFAFLDIHALLFVCLSGE